MRFPWCISWPNLHGRVGASTGKLTVEAGQHLRRFLLHPAVAPLQGWISEPAAERVQAGFAPRFYAEFRRLSSPGVRGPDSAHQALSVALWFAVVEYLAERASHFLKTFLGGGVYLGQEIQKRYSD